MEFQKFVFENLDNSVLRIGVTGILVWEFGKLGLVLADFALWCADTLLMKSGGEVFASSFSASQGSNGECGEMGGWNHWSGAICHQWGVHEQALHRLRHWLHHPWWWSLLAARWQWCICSCQEGRSLQADQAHRRCLKHRHCR